MHYAALIPAYEPDKNMIQLLKEADEAGFEVVVVDDGSGPDYTEIFEEAEGYASVISYSRNRGKGYALRTGIRFILRNFPKDTVVVTMDCDGQHKVSDALQMAKLCEADPGCVYFGSREIPKDAPLKSRFGNAVTRYWFTLVTHQKVHDTQTGLRAFSYRYLPLLLEQDGDRYEYEIGVLFQLASKKITIREMPIETIYFNNNAGTHFRAVPDTLKLWKRCLRYSGKLIIWVIAFVGLLATALSVLHTVTGKDRE